MRPFTLASDQGLKHARRGGTPAWKLRAVARAAPQELDGLPEHDVRAAMRAEIDAHGLPQLSIAENLYGWLKGRAAAGEWQAKALLHEIKDLQDLLAFAPAPGKPYAYAFLCELKRARGGRTSPGQKRLAAAAGGLVAHGLVEAQDTFTRFRAAIAAETSSTTPSKGINQ